MKGSNELYRLVYDYYATRILFGFYTYGDAISSLHKICVQFRLAVPTVRTAFTYLERDGYIQVEASRVAHVVYKAAPARIKSNIADYFLPREDGLKDIGVAGQVLIEPLFALGLQRWEEDKWNQLREWLSNPAPDAFFMQIELYIPALSALDNRLLLNLYWEMVRYLCFPYLAKHHIVCKRSLEELGNWTKEEIIHYLKAEHFTIYHKTVDNLFSFLKTVRPNYVSNEPEPIPFQWSIYRQRPQIRYFLAANIIRGISSGIYTIGSYLPSLPQMAERYGTALSTIRRTVSLLNDLGVAASQHGKGVLICMTPQAIDFSSPDVHEMLDLYLESFQMLVYTSRSVSLFTLQSVSKAALEILTEQFRCIRKENRTYLYFEIYLAFIVKNCSSAMVRECYDKLKLFLACGYPVTLMRLKKNSLGQEYEPAVLQAVASLEAGDTEGFTDQWCEFLSRQESEARSFIMEQWRHSPNNQNIHQKAGDSHGR